MQGFMDFLGNNIIFFCLLSIVLVIAFFAYLIYADKHRH